MAQEESASRERESAFLFQVLLKSIITYGKRGGEPGYFHPIINE
jgi:hypothetical protein